MAHEIKSPKPAPKMTSKTRYIISKHFLTEFSLTGYLTNAHNLIYSDDNITGAHGKLLSFDVVCMGVPVSVLFY